MSRPLRWSRTVGRTHNRDGPQDNTRALARLAGIGTAGLLVVFGAFHVYWAAGGTVGSSGAVPERDGQPLFRPSQGGTLGVAGALFVAASIVLARAGVWGTAEPARRLGAGTWLLAAVFAARAVGDFRYVGLFKRVRDTLFARRDSRLFSPLCAIVALGSLATAVAGRRRRRLTAPKA